jgi:hypothetical protein
MLGAVIDTLTGFRVSGLRSEWRATHENGTHDIRRQARTRAKMRGNGVEGRGERRGKAEKEQTSFPLAQRASQNIVQVFEIFAVSRVQARGSIRVQPLPHAFSYSFATTLAANDAIR